MHTATAGLSGSACAITVPPLMLIEDKRRPNPPKLLPFPPVAFTVPPVIAVLTPLTLIKSSPPTPVASFPEDHLKFRPRWHCLRSPQRCLRRSQSSKFPSLLQNRAHFRLHWIQTPHRRPLQRLYRLRSRLHQYLSCYYSTMCRIRVIYTIVPPVAINVPSLPSSVMVVYPFRF